MVCEFRRCGSDKGVLNCGYCAEYPCDKLISFQTLAPAAKTRLGNRWSSLEVMVMMPTSMPRQTGNRPTGNYLDARQHTPDGGTGRLQSSLPKQLVHLIPRLPGGRLGTLSSSRIMVGLDLIRPRFHHQRRDSVP